ncbi:sigma factor [Actinosynnema sp. NPDC050436]|uniref:sigma factor n=1 Tax=Actinosynnema sp. NPDC050436 TaxID=3155659 RepID=UPI0033F6FE72
MIGRLYERHVEAARNLARALSRSAAEADDLVSDAFAKVLDVLRDGRGPDTAFRVYLFTALRHTAYDRTRRDKPLRLADDVTAVSGVEQATSVPFQDPAVATLERFLASRAFAGLPERRQTVLWQTEIEGQSGAAVPTAQASRPTAPAEVTTGASTTPLSTAVGAPVPGTTTVPGTAPTPGTGTATAPGGGVPTTTGATTAPELVPSPPAGFALGTGGPPTDLPVTVRNTGTTPVPALDLPDGVQVVGPGNTLRRGRWSA